MRCLLWSLIATAQQDWTCWNHKTMLKSNNYWHKSNCKLLYEQRWSIFFWFSLVCFWNWHLKIFWNKENTVSNMFPPGVCVQFQATVPQWHYFSAIDQNKLTELHSQTSKVTGQESAPLHLSPTEIRILYICRWNTFFFGSWVLSNQHWPYRRNLIY